MGKAGMRRVKRGEGERWRKLERVGGGEDEQCVERATASDVSAKSAQPAPRYLLVQVPGDHRPGTKAPPDGLSALMAHR